ncbi:uncharacterized protein DSM5745_06583 [Aspergillus mulundensis]|uniref:Uncharacterized protein n=1 Tax=Aspergillus mulundensis TaxID=1810919 RepID=A0A3D8RS01_9EURO|nr:hypothetical protein DSM5745_06583 [Aspergillus mulundensis]RDW76591.1 hypothetical protein DSM5745_06583 [Aspergillus mulundensis]
MPITKDTIGPTRLAYIVTETARVLDCAQIPYILWGWQALSFYGINEDFPRGDFVVPDGEIHSTFLAIIEAGHDICLDKHCSEFQEDRDHHMAFSDIPGRPARDRYHPVGEFHFHPYGKHTTITFHGHHYGLLIKYKPSSLLWWMKENEFLFLGHPPRDHPRVTLSDDPLLPAHKPWGPTGPWTGMYQVKILNEVTFCKSVEKLCKRDGEDRPNAPINKLWRLMIHSLTPPCEDVMLEHDDGFTTDTDDEDDDAFFDDKICEPLSGADIDGEKIVWREIRWT